MSQWKLHSTQFDTTNNQLNLATMAMIATHEAKSVLRLSNVSETCRKCFRGGNDCTTSIRAGDLVLSELVRLDTGATLRRYSHLETCIGKHLHRNLPSAKSALATLHPLDYDWYCDRISRDRTAIDDAAFLETDADARARKLDVAKLEAIRREQDEYDARVVMEAEAARADKQAAQAANKQHVAAFGVDARAVWYKAWDVHQHKTGPMLLKSSPVFGWDVVKDELRELEAKQNEEAAKEAEKKAAAQAETQGEGSAATASSSAAADSANVGEKDLENEWQGDEP
ncbi:hypothetical protein BCR44DRAFT_91138 [Catenaria anguillulae PL171]|uniref:Uncharacterized protein n=1 Tax=Catenaria anguillulae PL171 TaxID=765915 RepID=A0A1Y2HPK8_9FUNG|nr:hypothetical protein BCR44DRAFT_91138 [Catenaria anguillulae PL171]